MQRQHHTLRPQEHKSSSWGALLLAGSILLGCDRCPSQSAAPVDASSGSQVGASDPPTPKSPERERDASGRETRRDYNPMFEIAEGPLNTRIYLQAGRPDFENRHTTTVMVTTKEPLRLAECSGLLVSPWVVLTAASCVCKSLKGLACAEHAYAAPIVYRQVVDEDFALFPFHAYRGVVRSHPQFQLTLDEQGNVVASQADLAVIMLDEPVALEAAAVQLGADEVNAGETLLMTGYGYGLKWGQLDGVRFTRRDKVTKVAASGGGRVVYEQQGAFLYDGFHGGPCFREDERGGWLVGVVSVGTEKETAFTSIHPYQDWLRAEIQRAADMARGHQRK
jgi:hypothetical protein